MGSVTLRATAVSAASAARRRRTRRRIYTSSSIAVSSSTTSRRMSRAADASVSRARSICTRTTRSGSPSLIGSVTVLFSRANPRRSSSTRAWRPFRQTRSATRQSSPTGILPTSSKRALIRSSIRANRTTWRTRPTRRRTTTTARSSHPMRRTSASTWMSCARSTSASCSRSCPSMTASA